MKKLYVLASKDLEPVYASVQAGHGVAQWLLDHQDQTWNNGYLIYLYADLEKWIEKLRLKGLDFTTFREPDLNNKITAISILDYG